MSSTTTRTSSSKTSKRSSSRTTAKGRKSASGPARRSFQATPTSERYKEIQQSLAAKGYFKGESDGHWGPDSVNALRRFQSDQNLEPDGKLGSLSLIALGLGPRRMTAQAKPESPAVVPNPANPPAEIKQ